MQSDLSKHIDHTLLKPEATSAQILTLCKEALENKFFGVCVNSQHLPEVVALLKNSAVAAVAVVGFPLGAMCSDGKAFEAAWCAENGAKEIDMVISIGALKEKKYDFVREDIHRVVQSAPGCLIKVIIETALLTDDEKKIACSVSVEAGAHYVKTCTGFNGGGATVEDIRLMRSVVGPNIGVKASGGIKTLEHANELIRAGASRLGTSSGVALVRGQVSQGGY